MGDAHQPHKHPLGDRFPEGDTFTAAVPMLVGQLPGMLRLPTKALNGSVDSLEHVDRAARRLVAKRLDDPNFLASLVAYVGEVIRNAVGGDWVVRASPGELWEPVIECADGRRYSTFVVFKELLERGSVWSAVSYQVETVAITAAIHRTGLFAGREPLLAAAVGPLAGAPPDTYLVTKRYGDGRPWGVSFKLGCELAGFPFKAGTEAWFARDGDIIGGTLSRTWASGELEFGGGTFVRYYKGHRDGRVYEAKLGSDQDVQGLPCKHGTNVHFDSKRRIESVTLARDFAIDGVIYPADSWLAFDRNGHVIDRRDPNWGRPV